MRRLTLLLVLLLGANFPARAEPPPVPVLTLPEAAASALRLHPDLDAARSRVRGAEARADGARAAFYPTLSATAGVTHNESGGSRAGSATLIQTGSQAQIREEGAYRGSTSYSMGLSGSQTVFDFGRRRSRARAADRSLQATREDLEGTVQDLLQGVAVAWFGVLREERSVLIQRDNVRDAEERLRQARGFYEAGTRARVEVTRAEADLASARLSLIQAENSERKARVLLGISMGLPDPVEGPLAETVLPSEVPSVDEAMVRAADHRPDLAAAWELLDAARARVNLAAAEYRPSLDARGNYQMADTDFPTRQNNWSLGMSVSFPVFNEPTLGSALQEAEAARDEQEAKLAALVLQVRREVQENLLSVREARERMEAAAVGVRSAEENFALASERYRVGVGSPLEVSEAQRLLVAARSQEAQAGFDLEVALVRFHRSTGILDLQLLGGEPPAP